LETLFESARGRPTAVIKIELADWRTPVAFAELTAALAVLHNRLLSLRKFKDAIRKGQLLHPAAYLAADEVWTVKNFPDDGRPYECYAYPAVARTLAAFLGEVAAAAPGAVPLRSLIAHFKDELEILKKRRYDEAHIRRLLKLDVLGPALVGARVRVEEMEAGNAYGEV